MKDSKEPTAAIDGLSLDTYLGTKIVSAVQMSSKAFNKMFRPETYDEDCENAAGYVVVYEDGYRSWSPTYAFEKAYRRTNGLTFGLAIDALKTGKYVARKGWNGKGMYIFLIGVDMSEPGIGGWTYTNGENDNYPLLPFIAMKTADEKVVPWLASQTDMLAEDWEIIDPFSPK